MSKDINSITISGRLTRDMEVRATPSGTPIGTIGLAYNGSRKNHQTGAYEDVANFIDCTIIGSRANALQRFLTKGTPVVVSGELRYSSWEKDGQKRSKHEIVVDEVKFFGSRNAQQQVEPQADVYDVDCPF